MTITSVVNSFSALNSVFMYSLVTLSPVLNNCSLIFPKKYLEYVSSIPISLFFKEISLNPVALLNRKKFLDTKYMVLLSKDLRSIGTKLSYANYYFSKISIIDWN